MPGYPGLCERGCNIYARTQWSVWTIKRSVGIVNDLLFRFLVVLHLKDIHLKCLFMLLHLAKNYGLGFVESWI